MAPNAALRAAVTALAREASNNVPEKTGPEKDSMEDAVEALWRSPARYLRAMGLSNNNFPILLALSSVLSTTTTVT